MELHSKKFILWWKDEAYKNYNSFYGFTFNGWSAQAMISGSLVPSSGSIWLNLAYFVVRYGHDTEVSDEWFSFSIIYVSKADINF